MPLSGAVIRTRRGWPISAAELLLDFSTMTKKLERYDNYRKYFLAFHPIEMGPLSCTKILQRIIGLRFPFLLPEAVDCGRRILARVLRTEKKPYLPHNTPWGNIQGVDRESEMLFDLS
jgi:hypothetical protein